MSDKIVNHFVLADGSTAKYDAESLENYDDMLDASLVEMGHAEKSDNLWDVSWEFGSFDWGSGNPTNATAVIRTTDFIEIEPQKVYSFYDGRDWAKANYNVSYPIQYAFEYNADGTFLRYQALYTQGYVSGDGAYKVKFRSNTVPANFELSSFNSLDFLMVNKRTYRGYTAPYSRNTFEETFAGSKSDNLFNGKVYRDFFGNSNGNVDVQLNNSYLMASSDYVELPENHGTIYWTLYNVANSSIINQCIFYNADFEYISYAQATAIDATQVWGLILGATIPSGAKYAIVTSHGSTTKTDANVAMFDALSQGMADNMFVTCNLDLVYANNGLNGNNKVDGNDANHAFLEQVKNNNIRDFMLSALEDYSDELLEGGYDATISAITDIHTNWLEPYAVLDFMANSGAVDLCVNLGDSITEKFNTKSEAEKFLSFVFKAQHKNKTAVATYSVPGNHDTNPVNASDISDGTNMILPNEFYSLSQGRTTKGMLSKWNYGYVDIDSAKVRVVFLNTSDIYDDGTPLIDGYNTGLQQRQFSWFCNAALDFTDKSDAGEWAVLTMSHDRLSVVGGGAFETVLNAFANGATATATGTRTVNGYTFEFSEDVDYSEQGSVEYIGHISGHSHDDATYTFGGFTGVEIACAVRAAHYYENGTRKDYTRVAGTTDDILFDTVCIDRANNTVYLKRFGVGEDRQFTY